MADENDTSETRTVNQISDHTGQHDARFLLWRVFCSENNLPVETLPSELSGDVRDRWEKLKDDRLNKPAEGL